MRHFSAEDVVPIDLATSAADASGDRPLLRAARQHHVIFTDILLELQYSMCSFKQISMFSTD